MPGAADDNVGRNAKRARGAEVRTCRMSEQMRCGNVSSALISSLSVSYTYTRILGILSEL